MKKLLALALFLFGAAAYGQQYPNPPNVGLAANRPVICTSINPVQPNQPQWYFATDTLVMSICISANTWANVGSSGGTGTVTSFSAGSLSPLFTTSVATATTTPALSFSLSNAAAFTLFGNNTNASAAPSYTTMDSIFGSCSAATSALTYNTSTHAFGCNTTATGTVTSVATTAPLGGGTITTAGTLTCTTCATTTNGGALSGTVPLAISAAGAISATPFTGYAGDMKAPNSNTIAFSPSAANTISIYPFQISWPTTWTKICVWIAAADNSAHLYDVGVYDSGGNRLTDWGATAGTTIGAASTIVYCGTLANQPVTLNPGIYEFAYTGNSTTMTTTTLNGVGLNPWNAVTSSTASSGGALPGTITMPTATVTESATTKYPWFIAQ